MSSSPLSPLLDRPTLALVDRGTRSTNPAGISELERLGVTVRDLDYGRLRDAAGELRSIIRERNIDFVLFSQNDQVFGRFAIGELIRALRVGYSSFSGIDTPDALDQSRRCLDDLLHAPVSIEFPRCGESSAISHGDAGTFSLVFDVEQLACARYGLPRILPLLEELEVRATFFVTRFVLATYPSVLSALRARGHEVGWHGAYHEYLAGHSVERQVELLAPLREISTATSPVSGANFIGRMDAASVPAMIANGLDYFVEMQEHRYQPFRYAPASSQPELIQTREGAIWTVPINVETYNRPWPIVRRMIDSALSSGVVAGCRHLNILLHPFRDGSLRHCPDLRRLVEHLMAKHRFRPMPIAELVSTLRPHQPRSLVSHPANGGGQADRARGRVSRLSTVRPRTRHDVLGFLPEAALRLAYRMAPGRSLF